MYDFEDIRCKHGIGQHINQGNQIGSTILYQLMQL